ncbi:MAG: twin-arginine translocase subunit TatB [Gammaproteobacteria bacterium]|nr:twin-arginine translocase subunit TatB [Gammaproteobacteria bacterium]
MFDIGFWELTLIAVVALVVIGPERLPGFVRTTGRWVGKVRGFVTSMKREIDREIKADELKELLQKQAKSDGLHQLLEEGKGALDTLNSTSSEIQRTAREEITTVSSQKVEKGEPAAAVAGEEPQKVSPP